MTKHSPENRPPGHETDLFLPEPESVLHDRKMTCGSDHWMHARWKLASTYIYIYAFMYAILSWLLKSVDPWVKSMYCIRFLQISQESALGQHSH